MYRNSEFTKRGRGQRSGNILGDGSVVSPYQPAPEGNMEDKRFQLFGMRPTHRSGPTKNSVGPKKPSPALQFKVSVPLACNDTVESDTTDLKSRPRFFAHRS
jgi:hypothetical protein